jgi:hypothetical protein
MHGWNLFESRARKSVTKLAATRPRPGVFISHSRLDKEKARALARALQASKVDYYFDENDEELQLADERHDHLKVVQCIENGIQVCSHLLGIITENTKNSWWVRYEIGSANGRGRECAHLIDQEVDTLPSYIKAARIATNREALRKWLPTEHTGNAGAASRILEFSRKLAAEVDYPDFIPNNPFIGRPQVLLKLS